MMSNTLVPIQKVKPNGLSPKDNSTMKGLVYNIVRPGGHVAKIGVHGHSVDLQIQELWTRNVAVTMGLVIQPKKKH